MNILLGILLVVWGVSLMAFGLFLFYALLPLWYGLFGGILGFSIGSWMLGSSTGWFGSLIIWVIAIVFAALFAGLAYQLEPFRRILAGVLIGYSLGALVAALFGGALFLTVIFGVVGALIFGILVPLFFDPMIVAGSAFTGAALVMDGIVLILPFLAFLLQRYDAANSGNFLAILMWIVLGSIGFAWQLSNLSRWVQASATAPARI